MHKKYFPFALFFALLAAGCATSTTPQEKSALEKQAERPVICKAGEDCADKWKLTEQWIKMNSVYKIIAQSNALIETVQPSLWENELGFAAHKKTLDDNRYNIVLDISCNDWFECGHKRLDAHARFANFVMGPVPAAGPGFGIRTRAVNANLAQKLGMTEVVGLVVTAVKPGSKAEKTGLRVDDVIVQYDDVKVLDEIVLTDMMSKMPPDKQVNIVIIRNQAKQTLHVSN